MAGWLYNLLHGWLPGSGFLGRSASGGGPCALLSGADAVGLLPAATSSAAGKMTAAQAEGLAFLLAGCFGGIHVHDATASQSIASGSAYTKLSCFTDNDPSSNCSADAANDKITLTKTGYYQVFGKISTTASGNNILIKLAAFLGDVEQNNCHSQVKLGAAGDMNTLHVIGIIDCTSENTDLDLRLAHDSTSSVDVTIKYANLNVQWIGNT